MRDVHVRPHVQRREGVSDKDIRRAKRAESARQRALVGSQVGPEELAILQTKLNPRRFPGMSGKMGAVVGYILEVDPRVHWTDPRIDEMAVTSDGFVMASHQNEIGMNHMIGTLSDLERNWENLLDYADLTAEERGWAEHLFRVKIEDHRV